MNISSYEFTAKWLPNGSDQRDGVLIYQKEWFTRTSKIPDITIEKNYIFLVDVKNRFGDHITNLQIKRTCTFEDVCIIGPLTGSLKFHYRNGYLVTSESNECYKNAIIK